MYGSQQPPHYAGAYQNPPPPEWQSQNPPPVTTYNPNTYGPINPHVQTSSPPPSVNTAHSIDTSSWGVRYNQHTGQEPPPPPLPPRNPDLYSAPSPPPPPPPPRPTSSSNPMSPSTTPWDYNTAYTQNAHTQSTQSPPPPPPKPPLPAAYQNEMAQNVQQWQTAPQSYGPQYSQHPPTHHYDPSAQPAAQFQAQNFPNTQYDPGVANYQHAHTHSLSSPPPAIPTSSPTPAPPGTIPNTGPQWSPQSNTFASTASILGHGNVSDWEHFSPTPGDVDGHDMYQNNHTPGPPMAQINTALPLHQESIHSSPQRHTPVPAQTMSPSSSHQAVNWPSPIQNSHPYQAQTGPTPPRNDSTNSDISLLSQKDRTDTIDGVIQAWNQQPVSPINKLQSETYPTSPAPVLVKPTSPATVPTAAAPAQPQPSQSPVTFETQRASPLEVKRGNDPEPRTEKATGMASPSNTNETVPSQVKPLNPYDDLDPWSKSSLFRYVTMLRKEAVAESEEEKHKIFMGFVAKETRLREVLYNVEPSEHETKQVITTAPLEKKKTIGDSVNMTDQPQSHHEEKRKEAVQAFPDDPIPVESEEVALQSVGNAKYSEDSEDLAYSPGGRPMLNKQTVQTSVKNQGDLHRSTSNPLGRITGSTGGSLVNESNNGLTNTPTLRSTSVPPASMNNNSALATPKQMTSLVSEPPQPAYTPFRYAEGPQRGSETLIVAQPGYQAYSALRQASAESGRAMSAAPMLQTSSKQDTDIGKAGLHPDETFLGVIREKSVSYREQNGPGGSQSGLEELGALVPDPFPTLEESVECGNIRKKMEVYSDDFRYIYVTTETWDLAARDRREMIEKERLARQEASEAHIDSLFNEKVIGYADINPLEEEFRQGEARTQLEEERKELDSYIRKVYNPVDIRLKEEIVELKALYQRALDELSQEKIHANSNSKYQISRTMKLINTIACKLEARYQKRLDLGLDREHHRKKAERRPLVFLGDPRALKKLDADFEKMEKQNIVEAAKDRDERANKLTDVFDEAIMHALGNHQSVLDDIAAKIRKLDVAMVERSNLSEGDKELLLRSISALTNLLAEDAESMLTSFKEADTLLNEADYKVSVAEAQYAGSDPEVFRRLEDEKKKEDDKIREDHKSKLKSIKTAPAEISQKIDEILGAMHKERGPGPGPWRRPAALINTSTDQAQLESQPQSQPQSLSHSRSPSTVLSGVANDPMPAQPLTVGSPPPRPSVEIDQQERHRKALEEAKKRNAAKNYTT